MEPANDGIACEGDTAHQYYTNVLGFYQDVEQLQLNCWFSQDYLHETTIILFIAVLLHYSIWTSYKSQIFCVKYVASVLHFQDIRMKHSVVT